MAEVISDVITGNFYGFTRTINSLCMLQKGFKPVAGKYIFVSNSEQNLARSIRCMLMFQIHYMLVNVE